MKRFATIVLPPLAIFAAACGPSERAGDKATGLSPQRLMLSQGYSMLYRDADKIDEVDLVLYVKIESEEFDHLVTEISRAGGELKKELEAAARDYPGVRIDLQPLPEMEIRKRAAIGRDKARQFAPFAGRSRLEYERMMLIGLANGLNHESHLCQVMAAEEPNAGLKKILLAGEKRYAALSAQAMELLNRVHFKHNNNSAKAP